MSKQYHILNGDSLKQQFPENLEGELIVARECLVDGSVKGSSLSDFFKTRATFISGNYDGYDEQDYFEKTVTEFEKMQTIPDHSDINLWFEDDLFCQVNLWFVLHLLYKSRQNKRVFLVRPRVHSQLGFSGLTTSELSAIYEDRMALTELDSLSRLWELYQENDMEKLVALSGQLKNLYPFLLTAVKAHFERIPTQEDLGRPSRALIGIMKELNTKEFLPVFKEFNKRESIYGFGDLQVKRLFDKIVKH